MLRRKFVDLKKIGSLLFVALLIASGPAEARNCKKGKPCGNSCIAQHDVCHKDSTTSSMTSQMVSETPAVSATETAGKVSKSKHCSKGKPCGNTCIAKDAVCRE